MQATQHPTNNDVLRPPAGMTNEECRPLAITRVQYEGGQHGVWSFWRPTAKEREAIAAGALVQFCVMGQTHPPILLLVDGVEQDA